MKRIIYSGITKTIVAFLLIFSCCVAVHFGFLTLRGPVLYKDADTVYETEQYSKLFSKYVERTAVYVRYREDGYKLSTSEVDSELALMNTNRKFTKRFHYVEEKVKESGKKWSDFTLNELDELWNAAK